LFKFFVAFELVIVGKLDTSLEERTAPFSFDGYFFDVVAEVKFDNDVGLLVFYGIYAINVFVTGPLLDGEEFFIEFLYDELFEVIAFSFALVDDFGFGFHVVGGEDFINLFEGFFGIEVVLGGGLLDDGFFFLGQDAICGHGLDDAGHTLGGNLSGCVGFVFFFLLATESKVTRDQED